MQGQTELGWEMIETARLVRHTARIAALGLPVVLAFAATACGGRGQEDFAKIPVGGAVATEPRTDCVLTSAPGILPDPGAEPAGMPFPTPAGARVAPGITGIPLPSGAVEVDAFEAAGVLGAGSGRRIVQVYDVALPADAVLSFFEVTFKERGWVVRGTSMSPAGVQCDFAPAIEARTSVPSHWITVSTAYVPRPGEETQPPPGFRGKGVPFAGPVPGSTRFWLSTPK